MNTIEKIILGISWGIVTVVVIYIVWVFAKYGVDPNHVYFHLF